MIYSDMDFLQIFCYIFGILETVGVLTHIFGNVAYHLSVQYYLFPFLYFFIIMIYFEGLLKRNWRLILPCLTIHVIVVSGLTVLCASWVVRLIGNHPLKNHYLPVAIIVMCYYWITTICINLQFLKLKKRRHTNIYVIIPATHRINTNQISSNNSDTHSETRRQPYEVIAFSDRVLRSMERSGASNSEVGNDCSQDRPPSYNTCMKKNRERNTEQNKTDENLPSYSELDKPPPYDSHC